MEVIQEALFSALATILVAVIGYVAQKVAAYLKEKGIAEQLSTKSYLVDIAVNAVEQMWLNEDGAAKFEKAKDEAIKLLNDNGLFVEEHELDALIESSVKAMNDGFNSVKEKEVLPVNVIELEKGDNKQ